MTPKEERAIREALDADETAIARANAEVEAWLRQVCCRLERESDLRPRIVEARPKTSAHVIRKMDEKGAEPTDLYELVGDLVGARVVVYNLSDARALKEHALADIGCPVSDLKAEDIEYPTGYRAVHLNGKIGKFGVEIQIRTAVQDAWAVTSRADVYRSGTEQPLVSSLSAAQGIILHGVDRVLQEIRDLSDKSRVEGITADEVSVDVEETGVDQAGIEVGVKSEPRLTESDLDEGLLRNAIDALTPEDRFVLESPISEQRVSELKADIESQREGSVVRNLLKRVGQYERRDVYETGARFGNRMLGFKGPLVERSNWAQYRGFEFSRSLEDYLLKQIAEALDQNTANEPILQSWEQISSFVGEAKLGMESAGGHPDLVVVQGRVPDDLRTQIFSKSIWRPNLLIRNIPVPEGPGLNEAIEELPTLWIYEAVRPSIHVVDLTAFHYFQSNPEEKSNDSAYLNVEPIDKQTAIELLNANPEHVVSSYQAFHGGEEGRFTPEETVVYLQLQARFAIIEAGRIQNKGDSSLVRSALLRSQKES